MTATPAPSSPVVRLDRDGFGHLVHIGADGVPVPCIPVRAFPIEAPDEGISLVGPDGHELAWVDRLSALDEGPRRLLEDELAQREFTPVVTRIRHVSTFSTPSTWDVETDRGDTRLVLEGEENIRRLGQGALMILDERGVNYLIRDRFGLDKASRKLLERFL